jgi:ribosome-associated protein
MVMKRTRRPKKMPGAQPREVETVYPPHLSLGAASRKERKGPLPPSALPRASARRTPPKVSKVRPDTKEILRLVLARIDDMKAEDTITIDLTGKSSIADAMVVTSGRSNRQVGAIADHLLKDLAAAGVPRVRVEGMPGCDWVLIDAGDVIVHVFRPEVRSFYNLENMWAPGRSPRRQAN